MFFYLIGPHYNEEWIGKQGHTKPNNSTNIIPHAFTSKKQLAMAMTPPPSTSLHFPNPPHLFLHPPKPPTHHHLSFIPRATTDPDPTTPPTSDPEPGSDSDPFESRLSEVRLRYRSGTGKKAEIRKIKKGKTGSGSQSGPSSGSGSGVFLPPVPLKEPVSGGQKVEFGFSPYSERVNGRLAGLGLVGLLAVELATGKSVISYHTPSIVFIQVYFMAAVSALYLKFEKEKVSVWPQASADKQ